MQARHQAAASQATRRRQRQHIGVEAEDAAQDARRSLALRNAIPDMVFVIDAEGRYTGFSPGVAMSPLIPAELFLGRTVAQVMPAGIAEASMAAIREALRTQKLQVVHYELWEGDAQRQYECRIAPAGASEVLAVVREEDPRNIEATDEDRLRYIEVIESRAEVALRGENRYTLSFRELTVLDLMVAGLADKEISAQLGCSRFTVNKHVTKILAKLGARSRTEAAVRAIREGLLPIPD